jgi:hypothetical protein
MFYHFEAILAPVFFTFVETPFKIARASTKYSLHRRHLQIPTCTYETRKELETQSPALDDFHQRNVFNHRGYGLLGNVLVVYVVFIEDAGTVKCLTDGINHGRTKLNISTFFDICNI